MIAALVLTVALLAAPSEPPQQLDGLQGWVWDQVGADVLTPDQAKRLWSLHLQSVDLAVQRCVEAEPWWKSQEAFFAFIAALTGLFEYRVRKKANDTETKINRQRDQGKEDRYYEAVLKKAQQTETSKVQGSAPSWLKTE